MNITSEAVMRQPQTHFSPVQEYSNIVIHHNFQEKGLLKTHVVGIKFSSLKDFSFWQWETAAPSTITAVWYTTDIVPYDLRLGMKW